MAKSEIRAGDTVRSEHGLYGVVLNVEARKGAIGLDGEYTQLLVQYRDGAVQRCNPELTTKVPHANARDSEINRVLGELKENMPAPGSIGRAEVVDRLLGLRELLLGKSFKKGEPIRRI